MSPSRSLSGLVVTLFAIVALLVGVVFVAQLIAVINLRGDTVSGRRTTDLLTVSYGTEISVLDMETGLRGFLLTREPRFLQPYYVARGQLDTELARLDALATGRTQSGSVGAIDGAIHSYITTYAQPLIATAGNVTRRQAAAVTAHGKQLVDALRHRFAVFDGQELAARQARRNQLASQSNETIAIAAVGLVVSTILLVLLGAYVVRRVLRPIRRVAAALEQRRQGNLSVRVPEEGLGEVGELTRTFNEMAESLEKRTNELSDANRRLARAVAAAQEASRMKSDFLANMSHEIRTPLNGVVGMVTLLSGTNLSEEQREYVEMARGSSDTLIGVVSDILDVSKIEAGRLELEMQDFDLHDLLTATGDMLTQEAAGKGLRLSISYDEDVPQGVRGDRLRVGQVLGNLLSNAVKFTAEGEVSLHASLAERTNVSTLVAFEVRDTGIGIAPERLSKLFDPFTQADVSTTRQYGGTGLGLTICRDLTALMGGLLTASSQIGRGSRFVATMPFAPAAGAMPLSAPPPELRGLRVLVVDDNAANRRIIEAYVSAWGMSAGSARNATQAVLLLEEAADEGEPFALALLDFNMPGENGLQLARRIVGTPRLRGTRLILLASTSATAADLEANGIHHRLEKPVTQSSLLDAIGTSLHAGLPVADAEAAVSGDRPAGLMPEAPAGQASTLSREGGRVLIAEDNHVNRTYVERLLARSGHLVTVAVDGMQVLEAYDAGEYDLVLMDCQMPELDGYEATRAIRRREEQAGRARTPIVAMTAAATEDIRRKCLQSGMDDYLTKPLAGAELERALSRWLPAPARPATDDTLDADRLEHLRALFPGDEATEMLVQLVAELGNDIGRLDASLRGGDSAGAVAAAHSIRGSAQLIGAGRLADAAADVEHSAKSERAPEPDVAELHEAWDAVRAGIEGQIAANRNPGRGGQQDRDGLSGKPDVAL
jgi:signal transduction histidine kinase/DNA-binding response OmpR family regulator/HPt (histidine-containing phosphotransfer) domain-containing protein